MTSKTMFSSPVDYVLPLATTPRAVVFDFGGVMTMEPNREVIVNFLCTSFNISVEEFEKISQEKRKAIKLGKTDVEFWLEYAQETKICLPEDWVERFNTAMKNAIGINPEMYKLVDQLKERLIPVAMLSNIDDRLAKIIRHFGLYEPFDPCLLSYEIGVEKPNSLIYTALLERMNLPAKEIVFIDDKQENIEAAKQLGFDTILFTSRKKLQKELERRGLL